jgi:hypothetical protein
MLFIEWSQSPYATYNGPRLCHKYFYGIADAILQHEKTARQLGVNGMLVDTGWQ